MFRFAVPAFVIILSGPAAAQDAEAGEDVFKKCAACHMVGDDAKSRVGPVLNGVIGRPAGSFEGFKYSKAMKSAGDAGLIWSEDEIFAYLEDPSAFLKGFLDDPKARSKMAFRLKDERDRRDVVAYLSTFSDRSGEEQAHLNEAVNVGAPETSASALCVRNRNSHAHFFAVEADGAERRTGMLDPGERLCTEASPGATGMVSVFEEADSFEGCSRLVPVGETEDMLRYVDFDRCFWSSNT